MKHLTTNAILIAAALVVGTVAAHAQGMGGDRSSVNNLTHPGQGGSGQQSGAKGISSSDAARIAGKQTGGRVLEVSPRGKGYNVKVYVQGKVRTVYVD
jgi:uncharacterized membrane protein YkoI